MCDANDFAVRAVLGQCKDKQHYAISYASKTLTAPQLNYATTEKELLAVVFVGILQQQQQHSLFSQESWGRLEMKPERNKFKVQAH